MFDYSPINTYPCTPPGAATNIKKKKTGKRQGCEFALVAKVKADNNPNNVLQIAAGGKVQ